MCSIKSVKWCPFSFQQLINGHEAFKRALPAAQQELNSMLQEVNEVNRLVEQHDLPREIAVNPYTMFTHEVRAVWLSRF